MLSGSRRSTVNVELTDAHSFHRWRPHRTKRRRRARQGVRVSDPATVEIAEMVLCGSINKGIANSIKRAGGRALGLSGKDDNLLIAKKLGKKVVDEETGEVKVRRHRDCTGVRGSGRKANHYSG